MWGISFDKFFFLCNFTENFFSAPFFNFISFVFFKEAKISIGFFVCNKKSKSRNNFSCLYMITVLWWWWNYWICFFPNVKFVFVFQTLKIISTFFSFYLTNFFIWVDCIFNLCLYENYPHNHCLCSISFWKTRKIHTWMTHTTNFSSIRNEFKIYHFGFRP